MIKKFERWLVRLMVKVLITKELVDNEVRKSSSYISGKKSYREMVNEVLERDWLA